MLFGIGFPNATKRIFGSVVNNSSYATKTFSLRAFYKWTDFAWDIPYIDLKTEIFHSGLINLVKNTVRVFVVQFRPIDLFTILRNSKSN
jgi:hypothetical protein